MSDQTEQKPAGSLHPQTAELLRRRKRQQAEAAAEIKASEWTVDAKPAGSQQVVVVDIDIPFGSMVMFMIKWALASIPAMFCLGFIFALVLIAFGGVGAVLGSLVGRP